MAAQQSQTYNLALDEGERQELSHALEQCVTEARDEKRHTDSSQYRDQVAGEESRLRTLLTKVRGLAQNRQENAIAAITRPAPGMAEQIARAASIFEFERTGRMPKSVTVVLGQDTIVITLHEALSPAERAMAQSPTGAAQVKELHRRLFDASCESQRKKIKRIARTNETAQATGHQSAEVTGAERTNRQRLRAGNLVRVNDGAFAGVNGPQAGLALLEWA